MATVKFGRKKAAASAKEISKRFIPSPGVSAPGRFAGKAMGRVVDQVLGTFRESPFLQGQLRMAVLPKSKKKKKK